MDNRERLGNANFLEFRPTYPQCFGQNRVNFNRSRDAYGQKLKCTTAESQYGFIYSLNGNKLVADADNHNLRTQYRCFKPAEDSPILTHGMRTHHAIEQLLTMPSKDTFDHRSFSFGSGLIHSIYRLGEFALHKSQILIGGGIRQCQAPHSQPMPRQPDLSAGGSYQAP